MDEYEFEHFVADLWREMGWKTEVSQASVDAGIDVIATKDTPYHQKKVIQAKRYADSTTVGGPDIQQYASLKQQVQNADSVVIVTTSSFTNSAESRADDLNVKLVDGDDLVGMVEDLDAYDIVDEYLDITKTTTKQGSESTETQDVDSTSAVAESTATDTKPSLNTQTQPRDDSESKTVYTSADGTKISEFDRWHWVATGTGLLTFVTVQVSDALFGAFLLGTVAAVYLDMHHIRDRTDWKPRKWLYLGGLLVGLLTLPVYLVNRYRFVPRS
ncbi:restriction endonuclease [Halostella sp. PRR32]|uniref:restriction endonuclease n=1 Tax=Halostella sp. PRR32 TaxID=3098147 RepID=UPI002B1DE540|nr:restriction endonuclease [Halostella sp. PRR32]